VAHHVDGMPTSSRECAAVVVVVDDEVSRSKPLLRSVREQHPGRPILLLAPTGALADRATVVDVVTTILARSMHPVEVIAEVRREVARSRHPRSVSLFGTRSELLAEPLWRRGLAATVETEIGELIDHLASGISRAVVLMPDTGPLAPDQVVRLIRTDPRTRATVVVLIQEDTDDVRVQTALRDGVDDVFGARVDADDLAVAIKARLVRRAELEPVNDPADHRGTVAWSTAVVLIERMLLTAFRRSAPVGIGLLRLRNDHEDLAGLDDSIAREFRSEDVIARLDADHLVIALQGVPRRTILGRLGDLEHKFALTELGCRAIGLEFPIDGRSLAELVDEGRAGIDRAGGEGGPWLVGADWRPWAAEAPDVLLVDPDLTLGSVLSEVLGRRGIKVRHQPDALDALDELTGRTGAPLPRVVLMELDQRGIDGLQFLRQLRESGILHRCKIIVLSARSYESDLQYAFELGAEDYVGKPFSTPLLLHRLSRVLAS
jgi:CheY-like chemotaxis protein